MLMLLSNHMELCSVLNRLSITIQADDPLCNIAMQGTADKPCSLCSCAVWGRRLTCGYIACRSDRDSQADQQNADQQNADRQNAECTDARLQAETSAATSQDLQKQIADLKKQVAALQSHSDQLEANLLDGNKQRCAKHLNLLYAVCTMEPGRKMHSSSCLFRGQSKSVALPTTHHITCSEHYIPITLQNETFFTVYSNTLTSWSQQPSCKYVHHMTRHLHLVTRNV